MSLLILQNMITDTKWTRNIYVMVLQRKKESNLKIKILEKGKVILSCCF